MRVLVANHTSGIVGGAEQYLAAVLPALRANGVSVGLLAENASPGTGENESWSTHDPRYQEQILRWSPDVAFVHALHDPDVERWLVSSFPAVLFAHTFHGTCLSGEKRHRFPVATTCERRFGAPCLALYWLRGCGALRPSAFRQSLIRQTARARLLPRYRSVVVASRFMQREMGRHGASAVALLPLFAVGTAQRPGPRTPGGALAYVGRFAPGKGADVAIEAVRLARDQSEEPFDLVLVGDGPLRPRLETMAGVRLGRSARFTGWLCAEDRDKILRDCSLLLMPSMLPEPFGLVGLEAARLGVPTVAFDVGGISEWLTDSENGVLVRTQTLNAPSFALGILKAISLIRSGQDLGERAWFLGARFGLDRHVAGLLQVLERAIG